MALTKVETKYGIVSGVAVDNDIAAFKGVPYAKPPVGFCDLRPRSRRKHGRVRWRESFKPGCIQPHRFHDGEVNPADNISEDCLYLNIWTPAKAAGENFPLCSGFTAAGSPLAVPQNLSLTAPLLHEKGYSCISCLPLRSNGLWQTGDSREKRP